MESSLPIPTKHFLFFIFVLLIFLGLIESLLGATATFPSPEEYYDLCSRPFICGNISFRFPFSDSTTFGFGSISCGLPQYLIACDTSSGGSSLDLSGKAYRVKRLYPEPEDRAITIADIQLIRDLKAGSCESLRNLTISVEGLSLPQPNLNLTFIHCSHESMHVRAFEDMVVINRTCSESTELYLMNYSLGINRESRILDFSSLAAAEGCAVVGLPVSAERNIGQLLNTSNRILSSTERWDLLFNVLNDGFPLVWSEPEACGSCEAKGGLCGYNSVPRMVECLCKDSCGQKKHTSKRPIVIGTVTGVSSLLVVVVALSLLVHRKKLNLKPRKLGAIDKDHLQMKERINAESFIRTYKSTMLSSYKYNDIRKMTNGFKEKLNEGGYGIVYKGRLADDRLVAVKVLDKSGNEGRDFINEVATIGRIHHLNIINLFGFCLEGQRQALVYEYMPNGSLADLLGKKGENISLGMEKLLEIALGIAHGITYMHSGCESRILHLDIKPQNILLDQNLVPKISDFGLAKIYSRHKSFVTVTGLRGTFGFIAPELFMRNLGNPSPKSDVYSFGMLLLDMVGGRTTSQVDLMNAKASSSSDSYFPGWIYEKLNQENINVEHSDFVVEEGTLASRKMLMVGIWCIQVNPKDRPSMPMVVEMLSGSVDDIKMPPKPSFFSPTRPESHSLSDGVESSSSLPLWERDNIE